MAFPFSKGALMLPVNNFPLAFAMPLSNSPIFLNSSISNSEETFLPFAIQTAAIPIAASPPSARTSFSYRPRYSLQVF